MVMQAKLLRVLEESQVERVGGDRAIPVDVRAIVATHRNLDDLVKRGAFRQDLYHRVYVFPLLLPPLRERIEDIPALAAHFAARVSEQNGWKPKPFAQDAIEELQRYAWPGNVRELRNVVERLLLLADGPVDRAAVRRRAAPHQPSRRARRPVRAPADSLRAEAPQPAHDGHGQSPRPRTQPSLQEV
jgi:transcriptional regulator with GAF, ATPase, and Fis domain